MVKLPLPKKFAVGVNFTLTVLNLNGPVTFVPLDPLTIRTGQAFQQTQFNIGFPAGVE